MNRGDRIVILIILLISLSILGVSKTFIKDKNEKYVSIQIDRKESKKYYIDKSIKSKVIPFETSFGTNEVEIGPDGAKMVKSSCPDQICVKMRKVFNVGEMIVCLPNRMLIEVKGDTDSDSLDIMVR